MSRSPLVYHGQPATQPILKLWRVRAWSDARCGRVASSHCIGSTVVRAANRDHARKQALAKAAWGGGPGHAMTVSRFVEETPL